MSRVGKVPVVIPSGVTVVVDNQKVTVSGAKGTLSKEFSNVVSIDVSDGIVKISPKNKEKFTLAMWGTARSIINNMVKGVSQGFSEVLEMIGVGYKAALNNRYLTLFLANSHSTIVEIPEDLKVSLPKPTLINIEGCNKESLGSFAALLIKQRPPEPYKGKGIRKQGSYVAKKEGKKG